MITIRTLLPAVLLTAGLAWHAAARDLTVVARGGALQDAQRTAYFDPFSHSTGIALHIETWAGDYAALQHAAGNNPAVARPPATGSWDMVQVDAQVLRAGCADGLFEKLDWSAIGGRDHYIAPGVSDCGVGAVMYSAVLTWDRDKFNGVPNWNDFWDVAKYPGKRGLRQGAEMNLEIALMADGVAPGDVYRVLRSDDGVDRAFRKLDQLKPYVVWWKTDEQAFKLLGAGDVLLSTAPMANIPQAAREQNRRFGVQWTGSLYGVDWWVIVKGSANPATATQLLAFMGDPAAEAHLTALLPYGGLAKDAGRGLTPDELAQSPSNPANLAVSLEVDDQFWHDNHARLSERFDTWLAL